MAILRSLIVSLIARTENFDQGMRKAEGSLRGFSTATTQFQGKIRGLTTELLKFSAAQAGIATALDVVRKGFQSGLNLERVTADLQRLTGSAPAARQALLLLEQTARATGFSLEVLAQGFTMLQTASRGTTLSFEDVTRIFEQFIRAARATNVAEDQLGNVFEELTELLNQQKISLSDLTPLLKQFPGLTDDMARAMGVSRAELERMSDAGELLTTVVLPRLAEEIGKTTQGATMPLTDSVKQLRTAWDELWRTVAESGALDIVTRGIKELTNAVKDLVNFLKSNESWLNKLLQLIPGMDLLRPRTAEAPGTGGLAPGQPRPGDVVPPAEGPTTPTPPTVDTSRQREIERLEQEIDRRSQELDALLKRANERMQQFPRDAQRIVEETAAAAEKLIQETETLLLQLERSLRELEQQGQKTQGQAGKTAEVISPQRAAIRQVIERLAPQYGLDPRLVEALVKQESGFNPRARGAAGEFGLMQLMPATVRAMGVKDPWDIEQNLSGGMKLLAQLMQQFNGDARQALAAYNAGPGRVLEAARGGRQLPPGTVAHGQKVLAEYERLKAVGPAAMDATAAGATSTTERLTKLTDQITKVRQQLDAMRTAADELRATQERIAAEDRYIELLIATQNEVNALTMSEEELALTSLERMQRQAAAQRDLQAAMRKDAAAVSAIVREELGRSLEERNRLLATETLDEMRRTEQRSVDELIGSLEDQVRVLTLTNREYLTYQLNLENAKDGEIAHGQALSDKVERLGMAREAADTVTDALIDMAVTGEISLKNLQETFSRMVLTMLADALKIRESLTKLFEKGLELAINALPSGADGGTASAGEAAAAVEGFRAAGYGGGLQHGGAVVPGRFYTVGESGPELLIAGGSGTVVPGGARPVVINMNVRTLDADSFRRSGDQIAAQMVTAAQRARRVL